MHENKAPRSNAARCTSLIRPRQRYCRTGHTRFKLLFPRRGHPYSGRIPAARNTLHTPLPRADPLPVVPAADSLPFNCGPVAPGVGQ